MAWKADGVTSTDRTPLFAPDPDPGVSYRDESGSGSGSGSGSDASPTPAPRVYARRWYVLAVFCALSGAQAVMWNTWGPVSDSASLVFGWSGAEIGTFAVIGNAAYVVTVMPACYVMDVIGMRTATLSMAAMLVVGSGIRCLTSHQVILFWMSAISSVLSGVAGTVTLSGAALFSSLWFPPSQRATCTAIIQTFSFLGVSASFVLGPAFVHYVNPHKNSTGELFSTHLHVQQNLSYVHGAHMDVFLSTTDNHTESVITKQKEEIMIYLYTEAGIMALLLLLVLVYFPSKPPVPPSVSASTSRLQFSRGLWALTKKTSFWLLALAYATPAGLFGVWGSVLNVNLKPIGVSQAQGAQIGLYYNLAGGLAGVAVSRFADILSGHMKQILIVLDVLAAVALWWVIMLCERYIPFNMPSLFVAAILASVFINSGVALFFELSSETCYPVAEGIVGGYLTLVNNLIGSIFLLLLYIPNIGTTWMNWTMFGGSLVGLVPLVLVRARYHRLQIDSSALNPSLQTAGEQAPQ